MDPLGEADGSSALNKQFGEFRDRISKEAGRVVHEKWPAKIMELNECLKNVVEFTTTAAKPSSPKHSATRKRKSEEIDLEPDALLNPNKSLRELVDFLKSEILQMVDMCNSVKLWIQLNIPRIEDGNNFGVSIQEEAVNELTRAEDSAFAVLESLTKYYVSRAKIGSKILKYPSLEDYRISICELDEKEYHNLKLCTLDLRNTYAILYDMIMKNYQKIIKPRTSNTAALY